MNNTKMKSCHRGGDPVGLKGPDFMNTLSSYQAGREDMKTIIRAEIERRIELIKPRPGQGYILCQEMTKMLQSLLSFLDTLQEQEVKEQKSQDTVGRVSVEIRSNLQTDEVVRKTLIMLVNDGRISVTGAITSSDILDWLEGQKEPEVDLEKEIRSERKKLLDIFGPMNGEQSLAVEKFARHFYKLRKNAK